MFTTNEPFGQCEPGRLVGRANLLLRSDGPAGRGDARARVAISIAVDTTDDPDVPRLFLQTFSVVFAAAEATRIPKGTSVCLPGGSMPEIEFDLESREIACEIAVHVGLPGASTPAAGYAPGADTAGSAPVPAELELRGRLLTSLQPTDVGAEVLQFEARLDVPETSASALGGPGIDFAGTLGINWLWGPVSRGLMLQPVFIAPLNVDFLGLEVAPATGIAFETLLARANSIWAPCCLHFSARDPIYLEDQSYRVLEEDEEQNLLAEVDVDDAIEVFVVERFEPEDRRGGGVTFNRGMATAKVITGDNQLPVNRNHLAHELGHVLNLRHPGEPTDTSPGGCKGSVMAPSGFIRDNPRCQCRRNCANVSNPLLFDTLWPVCAVAGQGRGPDDLF